MASLQSLRRPWSWPLILSIAVFLACLGAALREAMRGTEGHLIYALDDAYIHMAMAKNLARHGLWGCTPFHFSSSSSSPLWTFALGLAYRVFGVRDAAPLVLNVAVAVSTLVLADHCLKRVDVPTLLRAATLLGLVVALPMPAMVLMGMEHILHFLLTLWFAAEAVEALARPSQEERTRRRQTARLCILAALLAASRYEGLFLVGLACLGFLARRQLLRAVVTGAAACAPLVTLGWISVANGGFFLPNPLMLKAAGESASVLSVLLKPIGRDDLLLLQNDPALAILLVAGLAAAIVRWYAGRDVWRPQVLFPLLLVLMIAAHDHFVFSPTFWVYRYDAYLVAFGIVVAAAVLADVRAPRSLPAGLLPAIAVGGLVAVVADVREGLVPAHEIDGARNTYLEHYQAAEFIRRYHPEGVVIVNDLGAVTYYTETRILDVVGLGDIEPLAIMRRTGAYAAEDVRTWTDPYRPSVAIIQLGWAWVVPRIPAEWVKVAEVEVPTHHQHIGFFAVDPTQAWVVRASVQQHYGPLGPALGYRLKLRRPPA